ncbi:DUF5691 domain-containing protein [Nocardioides bruguierae]|uniref:DUF5691 domain-containing protein n=1 Tax=Nocardioides bruguierae TaxID=2945102 RepID=A0A9X2D969_9ACTN|nr:DUF5691 domain-containing protein [Nocardioides bruguierae]MCM0621466.1 DUF5691 domain-containing protein [Nocardioides bruguierae]
MSAAISEWTLDRVQRAAPDASSWAAARRLALPPGQGPWSGCGATETLLWGQCQGSGRTPYQVSVDLTGPAYRCSCPSRKHPCKHSLALLSLWVRGSLDAGSAGEPEDTARAWAEKRAQAAATAAAADPAKPVDTEAQAKRRAERLALMDDGVEDLARWLTDLARAGTADARARPTSWWEETAARLVDAQVPGLAERVRDLSAEVLARPDWPDHLLAEVGLWWTTVHAWRRRDDLPLPQRADLRAFVGWAVPSAEVRAADALEDEWLVLGAHRTDRGRVQEQRTWLQGLRSGEVVRLLDFAAGGSALPTARLTGSVLGAAVARYDGTHPRRALLATEPVLLRADESLPVGGSLRQAQAALADAWRRSPWVSRVPVVLEDARVGEHAVTDAVGASAPLLDGEDPWVLAALTGGRPTRVFGELEAGGFRALAVSPLGGRAATSAGEERTSRPPTPADDSDADRRSRNDEVVSRDQAALSHQHLRAWWEAVTSTALVGTARRPLPEGLPSPVATRPQADPATALLDAAATGTALLRASAVAPQATEEQAAAPDDTLPPASERAAQLLTLLLTQPPVGGRLSGHALQRWLEAAARAGVRAPHDALVPLLTTATKRRELRAGVREVLDARGTWLASRRQEWHWALAPAEAAPARVDPAAWALLGSSHRAVLVRRLRADDPDAARALVESTWRADSAAVRAELLTALEVGLGEADAALLEAALDDRAAGVREQALALLDALPGSPRAQRLADVLAPLVRPQGMLRRSLGVGLPDDDAAAPRDGLGPAPRGRSRRGWWLERLAAGAPLATWTGTGVSAEVAARSLVGTDAWPGVRRAVALRRDVVWARAVLAAQAAGPDWDARVAAVLPDTERGPAVLARVGQVTSVPELTAAVRLLPVADGHPTWDEATSLTVLARLERLKRPPHVLDDLVDELAAHLHPTTADHVRRLAASEGQTHPLHRLATLLDLVPALTEAFA